MPGNTINSLKEYCEQWKEYSLKIMFSDIGTYMVILDYNINQFPLLNALPNKLIYFINNSNNLISEYKKNRSKDVYNNLLSYVLTFCQEQIPIINLCDSKLKDIRVELTHGVSDIKSELNKLNYEYDLLTKKYEGCVKSAPSSSPFIMDPSVYIMACMGPDSYEEWLCDGYLINRLNFTEKTLDGTVVNIIDINQILTPLNAKIENMKDDINNDDADLVEIISFIDQLDS
ncbi:MULTISPECIES: hypothetical protein [Pectobacterium]|uniref:hypothetical protein n=1 Tax=Pectobacterium TaxID=122277 RepID=UPI000F645DFA|nr:MULTISPECIES: hypothetical protein [Pectobacterium]AZK62975.1 hypothetical protein EIP93_11995 [Pectobacterium versatile]QHP80349.1 hypothetical protein EO763_10670 [Pectobacterium odoriferum]TAI98927.1 hypothetical protein EG332_05325 [Pectobacterium versatile]UEQ09692.1 hypothetical protein LLE50_00705 [Pectobacterium versatile]ULS51358.1 hypothetical protein GBN63_16975 [Pectobacterium carotovorum]